MLKLANDERLDQALYTWFIQQRSPGTPISGPLLQEKVKHFSLQLHVNGESADHESFKASTGWLDKFKIVMVQASMANYRYYASLFLETTNRFSFINSVHEYRGSSYR